MKTPEVNFKYSFDKDAWSWVVIAKEKEDIWGFDWKNQVTFIPDNLLDLILQKPRKTAEELARKHLTTHYKKHLRQTIIKEELKALENSWRKIEPKFFKRLEKIIQKPIFNKTFGCYLTSGFMCPYNESENWFMVSMWHSIPFSVTTICHEIFHLQFLHYYKKYCRRSLSEEQTEELKEALTFILNTDFDDLILSRDNGYPEHQKLRAKLQNIWLENKEKSFQDFLDKAIKIVKKSQTKSKK